MNKSKAQQSPSSKEDAMLPGTMTNEEINHEITKRISGIQSMVLLMEGYFSYCPAIEINGAIFDVVSFLKIQRHACEELSNLHNELERNIDSLQKG